MPNVVQPIRPRISPVGLRRLPPQPVRRVIKKAATPRHLRVPLAGKRVLQHKLLRRLKQPLRQNQRAVLPPHPLPVRLPSRLFPPLPFGQPVGRIVPPKALPKLHPVNPYCHVYPPPFHLVTPPSVFVPPPLRRRKKVRVGTPNPRTPPPFPNVPPRNTKKKHVKQKTDRGLSESTE